MRFRDSSHPSPQSRRLLAAALFGCLPSLVVAQAPLWVKPSSHWYGLEGRWSAIGITVGDASQDVDVTVSTSLSEIWVIENTGCSETDGSCENRGGAYNVAASTSWSMLGIFQLGLSYLGNGRIYGNYGMESVGVKSSTAGDVIPLQKQVVAAINDTAYYDGFFGLGLGPGHFNDITEQSPIVIMAEQTLAIPSHSYGYTAGAYYRETPLSLTLGGYDSNRFEPSNFNFTLDSSSKQPLVLLKSIISSVSDDQKTPASWPSTTSNLLNYTDQVTALIDSTTPYLWLPTEVCDAFATAFGLDWNETSELYLFNDDSLVSYKDSADLSLTFTLASPDRPGDSAGTLHTPENLNITISADAFIQNLQYPFKNIEEGQTPVPYFPIKRADEGGKVIIGRSFLQEAYLITNYETNTFSVNQAQFPSDPLGDTSIQTIPFTQNGLTSQSNQYNGATGLNSGQLAGILVGASIIVAGIMTIIWWEWRRKKNPPSTNNKKPDPFEFKDLESPTESEPPHSLNNFLGRLSRTTLKSPAVPKPVTPSHASVAANSVNPARSSIATNAVTPQSGAVRSAGQAARSSVASGLPWKKTRRSQVYNISRPRAQVASDDVSTNDRRYERPVELDASPSLTINTGRQGNLNHEVGRMGLPSPESPDKRFNSWSPQAPSNEKQLFTTSHELHPESAHFDGSAAPAVYTGKRGGPSPTPSSFDYLGQQPVATLEFPQATAQPPYLPPQTWANSTFPELPAESLQAELPASPVSSTQRSLHLVTTGPHEPPPAESPVLGPAAPSLPTPVAELNGFSQDSMGSPVIDVNQVTWDDIVSHEVANHVASYLAAPGVASFYATTDAYPSGDQVSEEYNEETTGAHPTNGHDVAYEPTFEPTYEPAPTYEPTYEPTFEPTFQSTFEPAPDTTYDDEVPDLPTIPFVDRSNRHSTADTLGSNFTVEEEARTQRLGRFNGSEWDLVHIPQPADERYSWENQ